ncbi:MAG TPA: beta-galactosidase [Dehalococcoidia bacterium]|nr:beta-galactosidase [Dehalococcoidia bacterium]
MKWHGLVFWKRAEDIDPVADLRPGHLLRILAVAGLICATLVLAAAGAERHHSEPVRAESLPNAPEISRPTVLQNVGSGLFVFGARDAVSFDQANSSGGNPLLLWSELEPQQGVYDWTALDQAIAAAQSTGRKIVPRIYTNVDYFAQATPDWFFGLSGASSYFTSLEAQAAGIRSPVPWDPVYKDQFATFLMALGARYNGNPSIAFFQTNAGGGLYGELILSVEGMVPPGYAPQLQVDTSAWWLNQWLAAFPTTHLSYMINELGYGIGQVMADYAANYGVYLQQNTPWLSQDAVDIFRRNQNRTGIVLEVEDAGCGSATGPAFDAMISHIFSYGFAIDYLDLCEQSFDDPGTAAKLPSVLAHLR